MITPIDRAVKIGHAGDMITVGTYRTRAGRKVSIARVDYVLSTERDPCFTAWGAEYGMWCALSGSRLPCGADDPPGPDDLVEKL